MPFGNDAACDGLEESMLDAAYADIETGRGGSSSREGYHVGRFANPIPAAVSSASPPVNEAPFAAPPVDEAHDLSAMLGIDPAKQEREEAVEAKIAQLYAMQMGHAAKEEYEEAGWIKSQLEALKSERERSKKAAAAAMPLRRPGRSGVKDGVDELLGGLGGVGGNSALESRLEEEEMAVKELLEAMYPRRQELGQEERKEAAPTMPDGDRRRSKRRGATRRAGGGDQAGLGLSRESAQLAQEKLALANHLLLRASGFAKTAGAAGGAGGKDDDFLEGRSSPEASNLLHNSCSPSPKSPQGKALEPPQLAPGMASLSDLDKELEDLLAM